ncbi:hypothetical protein F2Q68_00041175 [Brassica cretica]|uniref:Pentatricopeptide repeat-containing protein n=1 Tax=Brassica cretica TaxID=69181 RepID=A0A8S9MFJ2_BRACR|nr:hypothetical protein F2Q68_00041175 [Brassica cretica]
MVLSGFEADKFTLSSVFSACAELENLSLGKQLHSWAIRSGMADDVGCSLVDMYAKCSMDGSLDDCRKVFDRMEDHSVMSWTALITGYMQSGDLDTEAIKLFCEMLAQGRVQPNHFTFSSAFKACGNLSDPRVGKQVLGHAFKRGLASNNSVANSVISMFVKSDMMEDARRAFESVSEKNLVSYNTFLDGACRSLDFEEAFELFHEITERELGVSAFTFASLLSGVASVGSIRKGEQIHSQVVKLGLSCNQPVCNALISMYSKCGSIDTASRVFNLMEDRNVISWTSMITGFAKHGFAKRVLETFNQMMEAGVKPNEVTYVAILSACSHVGLVAEGWRHFKSMYEDHKIKPKMEHYACMVDLLCRSGLLTDAFEFINTMPFQADVLVWHSCTNTLIEDCSVTSGDDCIAVKSGIDQYGIATAIPTQQLSIRRLTCVSPDSAGIAIGSEMSGGIKDVRIEDVTLINTQSAIRIKTAIGRGGYVKDIFARRFTMKNMKYVFWITGSYKLHPIGFDPNALPEIRNINYRDMTAENVTISAKLEGIKKDPFTGICMSNVTMALSPTTKKLQWNCTDVAGVTSRVKPEPCSLLPSKGPAMDCHFPTDKIPIESVVLNKCTA